MSNATEAAPEVVVATEEWWITWGGWLPGGQVFKRNGLPMGPFPSRDLALEVRGLIERVEKRDDLRVGRLGERDLPA